MTNQTLRRTVNNLIRQTVGEIAARAITGHATQAMTEHYSDVTMNEKLNAGKNALGWELIGELPSPAKKAETVFFSEKEHASSRAKTHSHGPAESSAGFCAGLTPKSTAEEAFEAQIGGMREEENPVNQ
ncbi:MAG: hypothetical protein GY822_01365 [Deltaproteobacteria bacterium]|nr:hypothetical protein [Deltaproteobacteria bacterium]